MKNYGLFLAASPTWAELYHYPITQLFLMLVADGKLAEPHCTHSGKLEQYTEPGT